jgi:hypothetical protein
MKERRINFGKHFCLAEEFVLSLRNFHLCAFSLYLSFCFVQSYRKFHSNTGSLEAGIKNRLAQVMWGLKIIKMSY